uniref:CUB domain-containing protein n=1 Tax=Panagrolaimus sp. JU765 TaxID=591449 RepID=A0AC34R6G2_9BILA
MKLLAAILFLSFVAHLDACQCFANQAIPYNVQVVAVYEPTDDGTASAATCGPIDCTTTVTVTSPTNGTLYGGLIQIVDCSGISAVNVLTISNGDRVLQNFTSCPSIDPPFNMLANTANTIKFHFNIQQPINFLAFVQPVKAKTSTALSSSRSSCQCQRDQTVTYNIKSLIFGNPTVGGMFGDTPCGPADCSTRIHITFPTDYLYFSQIKIVECHNFADGDFFTFFSGGQMVQNFTSCPSTLPFFPTTDTLDNNLYFHVQNNVSFTAFLFPTKKNFTETTTVITTTFPVTTTPYAGFYPYNPMTHRVDLIVALDLYKGSKVFNESKQFLQSFANIFAYNSQDPWISYQNATHPYARLSLMTFDGPGPFATGTLPWSLDQTSLATSLGTLNAYSAAPGKVFQGLNRGFNYMDVYSFSFRQNTQRVLVYFAATE